MNYRSTGRSTIQRSYLTAGSYGRPGGRPSPEPKSNGSLAGRPLGRPGATREWVALSRSTVRSTGLWGCLRARFCARRSTATVDRLLVRSAGRSTGSCQWSNMTVGRSTGSCQRSNMTVGRSTDRSTGSSFLAVSAANGYNFLGAINTPLMDSFH